MKQFRRMKHFRSVSSTCLLGLALTHGVAVAQQTVPQDAMARRVAACVACHGKEGRATSSGYFPRIAGKPATYLYNQLINFRDGRRQYPAMTYMVSPLSDAYLKEMADYFAAQHPPYSPPRAADLAATTMAHAQRLVTQGDRARNIPACIACHGEKLTGVLPSIPSLIGLPRDYLNAQFGAWKIGARKTHAPDCMANIARQLTPDEIGAVSTWLAAQPIPQDMTAAPAGSVKLPISCGSVPQ
ncbi:MAG: c-type cytochrome [Herminiimonas sp.]|nr:c-type cytochrome [Herminiimonas sp.]